METMDCQTLCAKLEETDSATLREAAYHAGELQCKEALPLLVKLLTSDNLGVQEAAEQALRKIPDPSTVRAVLPLLESDNVAVRNLAMDILRQLGSRDLDSLLEMLERPDPDLRIFAADILGATGDVRAVRVLCRVLLNDSEVNVRYQAAVALGDIASPAAAQCLNKALGDDEWVQFSVIEALIKIRDESSVDALVGFLGKGSELVDSMIVEALGEAGNLKAVPMLLESLEPSNPALRNKIVQALVKLLGERTLTLLSPREQKMLRSSLSSALEDEDTEVQDAAVLGLSYLGDEQATAGILNLAAALDQDKDPERFEGMVQAMVAIGLNDRLALALRGDDPLVASLALRVLKELDGPEATSLMMEVFWDKERDLQRELSGVLSETAGPEAVGFFRQVLSAHGDGHVIKQALKYLGEKQRVHEATEEILAFLEHRFDDVKEAALEASIHLANQAVMSRFEEMFESSEPLHRLMAVYAFGNVDIEAYMERLEKALHDPVPDIRKIALEAVGSTCATSPGALSLLKDRLHDDNVEVRKALMEVLGSCRHPDAGCYLLNALRDEDDWVKIRALESLADQDEAPPLEPVAELLNHPNKLIVLKAVETLGKIGDSDSFEMLLQLLEQEDPEIQGVAQEAVDRIRSRMPGEGE